MDRGHPVRGSQLLGMGFLSPPRSPCFSQGLVSFSAKGANSEISLLVLACKSLPPVFCEHLLCVGTMPGPRTQGSEAPTSWG